MVRSLVNRRIGPPQARLARERRRSGAHAIRSWHRALHDVPVGAAPPNRRYASTEHRDRHPTGVRDRHPRPDDSTLGDAGLDDLAHDRRGARERRGRRSRTRPRGRPRRSPTSASMPDRGGAGEVGIVHPFPIQSMAIPIALTGTDMIGQARTGTGKTLAFGVTMLQRIVVPGDPATTELAQPGSPQALVVAPDPRARQPGQPGPGRRRARARGPRAHRLRRRRLRHPARRAEERRRGRRRHPGPAARPGRPRAPRPVATSRCSCSTRPTRCSTWASCPTSSGSWPRRPRRARPCCSPRPCRAPIVALARRHLTHPVNIRAESADDTMTVPATAQFVYQAHDLDKPEVVARILQAEDRDRVMIFCRTKRAAQRSPTTWPSAASRPPPSTATSARSRGRRR